MKAREINSPVIKQLLDETTPEELAKIDAEMTNNKQQTAVLGHKTSLVAQTLDSKGNKQQTVVEWQFDQLSIENLLGIFTHDQLTRVMDILEQAKEMEKERMIGFTNKYINEELWVNCNAIESDSTVEQYYEQTYGGNK